MPVSTWLPWVACLGVGAVGLTLAAQNRELARRIEALESVPASAPERASAAAGTESAGPSLVVGGGPVSKAALEALKRELALLHERVGAVAKAGAGTGGASAGSSAFEQGVRDVLARVSDEPEFKQKVAAAATSGALPHKPTFAALAEHLALDASQENDFRHDLEDMQGSLFALLSERRLDGRVLLEEIGAADQLPEGDPKRTLVFLDLFQLKIPGTEETYVARAVELASAFRKRTDAYLKPEQRSRFGGLDVDLFGVKFN